MVDETEERYFSGVQKNKLIWKLVILKSEFGMIKVSKRLINTEMSYECKKFLSFFFQIGFEIVYADIKDLSYARKSGTPRLKNFV